MTRILKWEVPVDGAAHTIGPGYPVLVDMQKGPDLVQVWTEEPPGEVPPRRLVVVIATGMQYPKGDGGYWRHLGSVVYHERNHPIVWHVLEFIALTAEGYSYAQGVVDARRTQ